MTHRASINVRRGRVLPRNAVLCSFHSRTSQIAPRLPSACTALIQPALSLSLCLPHYSHKTATIPPHPHRNPIDMPASTAPAAHFKRLYRNCPTTATPNHTSSRGSHDRVLTFIYRLGTARQMFFPSAIIPGPPTRSLEAAASFQHDGASGE
jgi:hypothetical protein